MSLKMFQPKKPESQIDLPKQGPLSSIKSIIAVAAGKGGVGKSTVTVNLALALKHLGFSVGIMDTDIYGPSIRKMLPEDTLPGQDGDSFIPAESQGIKMISMAYFRKEGEAAAVRAPIANGMILQFIKNVNWGVLDFLLIDFPPGTGDIQLTLAQQANLTGSLLVTTPQEVALMDVRKAANLFRQVKIPVIGVVENMSYYQRNPFEEKQYLFGRGGGKRLSRELGTPFLGSIPIDPAICRSGDLGKSLFSESAGPSTELVAKEKSSGVSAFLLFAEAFVAHVAQLNTPSHSKPFELVWRTMA